MRVEIDGLALRVHIDTAGSRGERSLDLKYEIGGKELVYRGLDGDEYHSKVNWSGNSLFFTTVEHEAGRQIHSTETWTVIEAGKTLQRVKISGDSPNSNKATYFLDRIS